MSRNAALSAARRASRRPGLGAGAWQRRRRTRTVPPHDAIESQDGTWMTLSLDGEATEDGPSNLAPAPVSRAAPPQPPPLVESASDHPAATTDIGPSAFLPIGTDPQTPREEARSLPPASESSASISESSASISVSGEDSVITGEIREVVEQGPLLEEDTEAVEVPLPSVQALTLADELLPWPQLLVQPTLVLPGAWPPPPDALQRSAPSVVGLMDEPSGPLEELSLELEVQTGSPDLETGEPPVKSFEGVDSVEIAALVREVLAEPDTAGTLGAEEPVTEDEPALTEPALTEPATILPEPSDLSLSLDAPLEPDEPTDEPDISLVIENDDSVVDDALLEEAGEPTDEDAGVDDSPTEVSDRDALEDALAVLRTAEPGTALGPPPEDDLLEDEEEVTAEDLVSLEMVGDPELQVDPAVRTDLELTPVAVARRPRREVVWLSLAGPAPGPAVAPARAWIELAGPAVPTRPRVIPSDSMGPAEPSVADEDADADEDWLSDLGPSDPR